MSPPEFSNTRTAVRADYFELLGLPRSYRVDKAALERNYLERSKAVHPDRFVKAPAHERVSALQQSMLLNDAYKALKHPIARAEYLLEKLGVSIGDNERLDPTFLMAVLEAREELAEAKHAGDTATLRRLEDDMLDRRDAALSAVDQLFALTESDEQREDALVTLKKQVILLRYIRRYLDEFNDLFDAEDDR